MGGLSPRDGEKVDQHELVRITRWTWRVLRIARYYLRGSKYNNHAYDDCQQLKMWYREFCDVMETFPPPRRTWKEEGANRITLHKYSKDVGGDEDAWNSSSALCRGFPQSPTSETEIYLR
jgi:hypothetical protein